MTSSNIILKVENISKQYRLGLVGTGTISHDLNRWWSRVRGKDDPYLKVGEVNDRSTKGSSEYVWALQDINFEVKRGEVLGIIGKNGAGKSTLLKILSKVTSPTTGEIKTRGRIASLLEVGTGFHGEMTGRENIFLNGAILGMTKKEIANKIDEIIAFSGCERYIDTPVKRYSSGMTVRLAFAVAAFLEPEILVIDEVLAVGDAEFQKKAIGKMQDISRGEGRTVIFVSHNMAAVKSLCTRAVVLEYGETLFEGATKDAIEYYLESSKNDFSQATFKDRKGNGLVKIKGVNVFGKEEDSKPQTGKPFTIRFELENANIIKLNDIEFDIRIDDNLGQRVSWLSSQLLEKKYSKDKAISIIEFTMNSLQLNNGVYYVTTHIMVKNEVADWVQNAFSFDVEKGDYYGNNVDVPNAQCKALLNFDVNYL
ncbi:ABC transporter ATP-binding protein [Bizionia gelidisalsuginis]|uniref:ABC transporter ATP-binding protein n=1 Tax=Bizionia gelidisalsuginis TaxID=291188 RepID=A0ABY3MDD3_9FLAO|nr:ABC transporter ATP-binding protein [Bizionia gelidisalsuginis]TYC17017.1 ABC transporter ATP-binding protein [Bizionia gelidisalsuginis]